jgi:16S rRNA processing protein RimM
MGLEGIDSREAAQGYKNTVLYLHRDDIPVPKGAMLIADMIGLPVVDFDTGRVYGEISDVRDGVRYKLYTVKTDSGEVILPGVDEFIKEITEERGLLVRPIPGFFD